jgi:hypothetical protein
MATLPYPRSSDRNAIVTQIDATSPTHYTWFAGFIEGPSQNGRTAFVDRYRGHWRDMKAAQVGKWGSAFSGIAPVPGSAGVWVVGQYNDSPSTSANLAERWTCT